MRLCRKCGGIIPINIIVNKRVHNLQHRKFCLKCSSFKGHNTSKYDPSEKRRGKTYKDFSAERKIQLRLTLYKRGLERKKMLIDEKGGKCQGCGYDRCSRALCFHHRDDKSKLFSLSLNNLWSKPMLDIKAEAEKCDLLCANCHMEQHVEIEGHGIVKRVNEKYGTSF